MLHRFWDGPEGTLRGYPLCLSYFHWSLLSSLSVVFHPSVPLNLLLSLLLFSISLSLSLSLFICLLSDSVQTWSHTDTDTHTFADSSSQIHRTITERESSDSDRNSKWSRTLLSALVPPTIFFVKSSMLTRMVLLISVKLWAYSLAALTSFIKRSLSAFGMPTLTHQALPLIFASCDILPSCLACSQYAILHSTYCPSCTWTAHPLCLLSHVHNAPICGTTALTSLVLIFACVLLQWLHHLPTHFLLA